VAIHGYTKCHKICLKISSSGSDEKVCDLLGMEFATSLPHKVHKGNSKAELWVCSNTSLRALQKCEEKYYNLPLISEKQLIN
jgi:hypothetical protein